MHITLCISTTPYIPTTPNGHHGSMLIQQVPLLPPYKRSWVYIISAQYPLLSLSSTPHTPPLHLSPTFPTGYNGSTPYKHVTTPPLPYSTSPLPPIPPLPSSLPLPTPYTSPTLLSTSLSPLPLYSPLLYSTSPLPPTPYPTSPPIPYSTSTPFPYSPYRL